MCEPVTIGLGMMALTGVQIVQQNKAAAAQADASTKAAATAANFKQAALNQQANELSSNASEKATASELKAAQIASAAKVSAGEAGITGTGANRILGDIGQQQDQNLAIGTTNLLGKLSQVNTQKDATNRNLQMQLENIFSQQKASSAGPLEAVARMGASFFGGVSTGASLGVGAAGAAAAGAGAFGFLTPSDSTKVDQANSTGFSDDFSSGAFLKKQIANVGV